jgi:hypothetical protein
MTIKARSYAAQVKKSNAFTIHQTHQGKSSRNSSDMEQIKSDSNKKQIIKTQQVQKKILTQSIQESFFSLQGAT